MNTQKIVNWLKEDNLNIVLVAVLLFAVAIRLYYFFMVGNQPLWWDEACYGSLAKNLITHQWAGTDLIIGETLIRPLFFPIMWAGLLLLKIPEAGIRFLLEIIPSILSVFFVYLIGKEIFNKRIGIVSAFIFSVLWIHLFYSVRLLTNVPAMFFLFSSIYLFIIATKNQFNYKYFSISLLLLSVATLMRYPIGIIFFSYLIILILGKKLYLNKSKFWITGLIGISPILIFFLINYLMFGNIFPALLGGGYLTVPTTTTPIAWSLLTYISVYLKLFYYPFLLGGLVILFNLLMGYNIILKNTKLKNYLFLLLIFVSFYCFFIFYLKSAEDRYFLPLTFIMCIFSAKGIDFLYNLIKKYNKILAVLCLIVLLFFGAYSQITFTDSLIKNKKQSFLQIRQGFEWIKENTHKDSSVIGLGTEPYIAYYAERDLLVLPKNESGKDEIANADYLVVHAFNQYPEYINQYLQENQDRWIPINVFFIDEQKTQPVLVIYQKI